MATIVLDPGHGGNADVFDSPGRCKSSHNNARGPTGLLEKDVVLQIALEAEAILVGRGHRVILTRRGDNNVKHKDRIAAAETVRAPVFVSIHCNGYDQHVQGTETIVGSPHRAVSAQLSRAVQNALLSATGLTDRNATRGTNGVITQDLCVLSQNRHHSGTAACLAEISFMDVAAEETRLRSAAYRKEIANALAEGIEAYLSGPSALMSVDGPFEDGFAVLAASAGAGCVPAALDGIFRRGAPEDTFDRREFAGVDPGVGFRVGDQVSDDASKEGDQALATSSSTYFADFARLVATWGLRVVTADALLFMGASNASGSCRGLNSLPPRDSWPRMEQTAKMLDEVCHRLGGVPEILSAYRNDAYNRCVDGAGSSLHKGFNAIDFRCSVGTSVDWHRVAKAVRASDPAFTGGIGKYRTFVHIDTRGRNADWTG